MVTSDTDQQSQTVPSPCVRLCTLGDDDICVGCYRSIEEIKAWSRLSNPEKKEVVIAADARRLRGRGVA